MKTFLSAILVICLISHLSTLNAKSKVDRLDKNQLEAVVFQVTTLLESHYLDKRIAKSTAKVIESKLISGAYENIASREELAEALSIDLKNESKDNQLKIQIDSKSPEKSTSAEALERKQVTQRYKEKADNYGFKKIEILEGNIGYMKLDYFSGHVSAINTASSGLKFLSNSDAMIIDLRSNLGGSSEMLNFMISHFLKDNILINKQIDRNDKVIREVKSIHIGHKSKLEEIPLYILTGNSTSSKAEALSYYLQANKRALVVGEPTSGIANIGRYYKINNNMRLFIPTIRVVSSVTHSNWENSGVKPDIKVAESLAFENALSLASKTAEDYSKKTLEQKVAELKNVRFTLSQAKSVYSKNSKLANAKVAEILSRLVQSGLLDETEINDMGYRYLWSENEPLKARLVFEFNKTNYPDSYNVYGSLADSYVELGLVDLAIKNYKLALAIEPNDSYSKHQLENIQKNRQ